MASASEEAVPSQVLLSPDATREALGNLLDNARRHAASEVLVCLGVTGNQLTLLVRDDGPGLPAGTEERAFDRFVTLDGRGGSGLGLSIARGLVEKEGGRLTYCSAPS